jgi:hypothetical protein
MFHPQSYLATTELIDRVSREAFGATKSDLCSALVNFSFELYHGKNPQFQPCDTAFHDFDHTMQATSAVADLLAAHRQNSVLAPLQQRDWELAIAATILHDSGYLKRRNDLAGSGAKYSAIHVGRSCFHAWDLLPHFGFTPDELRQIQNAICATAISVSMDELPFRDSREWLIGALVATGDMLGQMAAEDYPERLAGQFSPGCKTRVSRSIKISSISCKGPKNFTMVTSLECSNRNGKASIESWTISRAKTDISSEFGQILPGSI